MPGTTRYSATFDRTYEEEDRVSQEPPPTARRSRSQSWQANSGLDGRPYTPLGGRLSTQRSSSTDNGPNKGPEHIPTRTVPKTAVKAHNNPFQFVKVGTCPLYKKAEEQLKKVKAVKKPDVLKEEEEDWQSNLDSWKSRRRKMSEDVFKRQEELKQLELEEQISQLSQKKTKTFSEMVESRAHRGRTLSLCLISSPMELQNWELENKNNKNGNSSTFSGDSEENSTANSEDEGVSLKGILSSQTQNKHRTNGESHNGKDCSTLGAHNGDFDKLSDLTNNKSKEGVYIDSGLESISSSHRAGDTPDSGSDFSQDSGSSIDCESPRTGVNILEDFSSKPVQMSLGQELTVKLCLNDVGQDFGFTFHVRKNEDQVIISSILEGSKAETSGISLGDQIITIDGKNISSFKPRDITTLIQKARAKGEIKLVLWRRTKATENSTRNGFSNENKPAKVLVHSNQAKCHNYSSDSLKQEKSIESENEMYVDDFEELEKQTNLVYSSNKSDSTNAQSANSQKVNVPAKQSEEFKKVNDSLNVVFQSQPKNVNFENECNNSKNSEISNTKSSSVDLAPDILPVEKVAEEMEKLILEQLEEEERAKELSSEMQMKSTVGSPENLLTAPPRCAEPPKEKPPPPPPVNDGSQKDPSLKRVNSTKRIKKEIHKRRSNFLGIDSADENIVCSEPSIPPPPALEEILKAEMELDRQSRLKFESEASERLTQEENEIMQKEREIIETLESEERQKQLLNGTEDLTTLITNNVDNLQTVKSERNWLESEETRSEEQQLLLSEEKQLREREEFIRQQEGKTAVSLSESSLSVAENKSNTSEPSLPSLSSDTPNVSLSSAIGDGKSLTTNSASELSENKSLDNDEKKVPQKPAVPPKPLKKKEAIRKERERLRQEQEALQREREEHRRKLMLEQEELLKHQKSHAPDVPVSRLGPLPPIVKPNFPSQLTSTVNATPNTRENASFPSRSHHGAANVTAGNMSTAELMAPAVVRQNKMPNSRGKAVQNESWGQQKMPSVRKQNQDSLTESRYNQNHWLIQEAEMRRISELKDRQRAPQLQSSQTHLAEDDVCSNTPRAPVITPSHSQHLNYAVQDHMWNYGQSNMPVKKYPPPIIKDQLHTVYPREPVSQQPPTKPSRVVPMERQEQMLSVSGRKRCSHCNEELGRGAAMIIESLQLYYHIHCFQCCVCQAQLGNGSCGTDVRVRNNKLHCHNCYSNDEAGLKFSQV